MTDAPLHVVAAIIVDDHGRVLACRRAPHVSVAGRWEFPGGKVEAGESPEEALVREIREELGVGILVSGELTTDDTIVGNRVVRLTCLRANLTDAVPTASTDHDELRWVEPARLSDLDWAEPDLPAVGLLARGGAGAQTGQRFMVAAMLAPVHVGSTFARSAWPAHVTVVGNFVTSAPVAAVVEAVASARLADRPFTITLGAHALFGPDANIPVLLVDSGELLLLHERAASAVGALPGFAADHPAHWGAGYRPHLTLVPGATAATGEHHRATTLVVGQLTAVDATIVAAWNVPRS